MDREMKDRLSLPLFLKKFLLRTYGLKDIATKQMMALLSSVRIHRKSNERQNLFARLAGLEEEDALDQLVGMLHLVDRFVPLVFGETADAPVGEHPVMEPVLVDCGQFVGERLVKELDDLRIAFHGAASLPAERRFLCAPGGAYGKGRKG